jgi:hypothetical protein
MYKIGREREREREDVEERTEREFGSVVVEGRGTSLEMSVMSCGGQAAALKPATANPQLPPP